MHSLTPQIHFMIWKKLENGKNARHAMEQRALDTILKRIVNENFEW
jgi:hypothetical protein